MKGRAIPTTSYDRYRRVARALCAALGMPVSDHEFDPRSHPTIDGQPVFYVGGFSGTGPTPKDALAGLVAELVIGLRGARCFAKRVDDMDAAATEAENLGYLPMMDPIAVCGRCEREWTPWEWSAHDFAPRTCVCGATVTRAK